MVEVNYPQLIEASLFTFGLIATFLGAAEYALYKGRNPV